jgi:hypothetical protein
VPETPIWRAFPRLSTARHNDIFESEGRWASDAAAGAPTDYKFRVYTSGQKRWFAPRIKRELRRRGAVEPVIGHLKAEHRMDRNYLAHHADDAADAVLAAAGCNFHLLLRWLELLVSRFLAAQKAVGRPSMDQKIENFTWSNRGRFLSR